MPRHPSNLQWLILCLDMSRTAIADIWNISSEAVKSGGCWLSGAGHLGGSVSVAVDFLLSLLCPPGQTLHPPTHTSTISKLSAAEMRNIGARARRHP